jgi:hypothetical protein
LLARQLEARGREGRGSRAGDQLRKIGGVDQQQV